MCSLVVNETLDSILDESGDEEEQEAVVNQVLDEIGIEVSGKVKWRQSEEKEWQEKYFIKRNLVVVIWVILDAVFIQAFCFSTSQMAEAPSAHGGKFPMGQQATASKGSADADIEAMLANLKA